MGSICLLVLLVVNIVLGKSALRYNPEDASDHFETFISTYEKEYDETEKVLRFEIFMKNLEIINYLNSRNDSAVYGITKFSDLTLEEFKQKYTGLKISNYTDKAKTITEGPKINLKLKDIPDSFDWRSKGMVSIVRNQGTCRSCWAFSTIGNMESAYAIKTQQSVILSEQQLVDCANDHCNGCDGGTLLNACEYLQSHGAMSEDSYSYIGRDGQCKYNPNNVKVKVNDCLSLKVSEDELAEKLVTIGPLSVGIDSEALQQYNGEPITEGCPGSTPDHAVLLVGYETDAVGNKYWLVKNSWGANWGDEGYFKMQRGVNCLNIMEIPAITAIV